MKYSIKPTSKFQKDLKRIQKRGYDLSLLSDVIKKLSNGESLPLKYLSLIHISEPTRH